MLRQSAGKTYTRDSSDRRSLERAGWPILRTQVFKDRAGLHHLDPAARMPGIEPAGLAARNYRFPKSTPRRQ
jgi:hypothetical protein